MTASVVSTSSTGATSNDGRPPADERGEEFFASHLDDGQATVGQIQSERASRFAADCTRARPSAPIVTS